MRNVRTGCLLALLLLIVTGCSLIQGSAAVPEAIVDRPEATAEILTLTARDGTALEGKLRLPPGAAVGKLVLYVHDAGPNTYDQRLSTGDLRYESLDLFAEALTGRGIAFFSYNTRGVSPGQEGSEAAVMDPAVYATYLPGSEAEDVGRMIQTLKELPALQGAKVYLLGWGTGTAVAAQAARAEGAVVDGLLLCGYMNGTLEETLVWRQSGGSSMAFYRNYFDADDSGSISPGEFEEDRFGIRPFLDGMSFAMLDADENGALEEADFALLLKDGREALKQAFEAGDDAWLAENSDTDLTAAWYRDFRSFPPNRETLPSLDLPIYIFHGALDAKMDPQGVEDIRDAFQKAGKANLTAQIFPGADHNLNSMQYFDSGAMPDGLKALLDACEALPG